MSILIPGALPDSAIAPALAVELEQRAPALVELFRRSRAQRFSLPPTETGCTPEEVWQLQATGFVPPPDDNWASGLGPWLHPHAPQNEPVWLAEFVHIAMGTEQVGLTTLAELDIDADEDHALRTSIDDILCRHGLSAVSLSPGRWHLRGAAAVLPHMRSASPATLARDGLLGWWHHDAVLRPWRRVLNEIQMAWHEHPVNQARAERGLLPVNSLWRYGGAQRWQPATQAPVVVLPDLLEAALAEDWGRWLERLNDVQARLTDWQAQAASNESLVLTGRDRLVALRHAPRPWWQRWRAIPKHEWKHWWQLHA